MSYFEGLPKEYMHNVNGQPCDAFGAWVYADGFVGGGFYIAHGKCAEKARACARQEYFLASLGTSVLKMPC